jgi:NADH-quinone oxidoreductase subunit M
MGYLSLLIFLPLFFALVIWVLPKRFEPMFQALSIGVSAAQVIISAALYYMYSLSPEGFRFAEHADWIYLQLGTLGSLDIDYFVAVDGLSVGLVLLTSIVMFIAAIASNEIKENKRGYFALFNLLGTAVMGVFCALDFFLFYVFYELMLLPLYFLIGMWGGPNREYASVKFFIYTLFGSVFMLLVMAGLYFSVTDPDTGHHTFNMLHMMDEANYSRDAIFSIGSEQAVLFGLPARLIGFAVLFIAFAIKIPVVPLHTWLPDAHVEAPTPISIILAGILLKIGAYGIIRLCLGIFPDGQVYFSYWIGVIGMVSILYGAFNALASLDLKRMIAFSSISHMGFVVLGIASLTSEGLNGAVYQMISHGILSAMLFFIAGVLYNRVHDRYIPNFRGLALQMPRYTTFVVIAFFASLGLPGMSGFIGEVFTLMGAFKSESMNQLIPRWFAVVSATGILFGAAYLQWTLQRMFFGARRFSGGEAWHRALTDLSARELFVLLPLGLIAIILGVYPSIIFDVTNLSVNTIADHAYRSGSVYLNMLKVIFGL